MAEDERELFRAYITKVVEAAREVFLDFIAEYAKRVIDEALSPGGAQYEQIMAGAIASAMQWYGLYSPKVYHRHWTLSQRSNIMISHSEIQVSGTDLHTSVSVVNVAPHAVYEKGFVMPNGKVRPGGDLSALIPNSISIDIVIPPDVARVAYTEALAAVMG